MRHDVRFAALLPPHAHKFYEGPPATTRPSPLSLLLPHCACDHALVGMAAAVAVEGLPGSASCAELAALFEAVRWASRCGQRAGAAGAAVGAKRVAITDQSRYCRPCAQAGTVTRVVCTMAGAAGGEGAAQVRACASGGAVVARALHRRSTRVATHAPHSSQAASAVVLFDDPSTAETAVDFFNVRRCARGV